MRQLLFICGMAALLTACKTRTANLTVLQPAQFKVPEHLNKLALVDRSKPSSGWLNVLEGIVTGEAIGQDRACRERAVQGLTDALRNTPRFGIVSTGIELPGSRAGNNLPAPLPWSEVERICSQYGTDGLVTIESFDSDNLTSTRQQQSKRKNKDGVETTVISFLSEMRTSVRIGWRFYDPKNRRIIDEFATDDQVRREGRGNTERAALSDLPRAVNVTRDVSFAVGREYGMRIAPVYVNVSRSYYTKAKDYEAQMEKADQFARANNWPEAAKVWKGMTDRIRNNPKVAGRAAYNLAIAAEMEGRLDLALELAEEAWTKYANKRARRYIQILQQRQYDAQRAADQMPSKV